MRQAKNKSAPTRTNVLNNCYATSPNIFHTGRANSVALLMRDWCAAGRNISAPTRTNVHNNCYGTSQNFFHTDRTNSVALLMRDWCVLGQKISAPTRPVLLNKCNAANYNMFSYRTEQVCSSMAMSPANTILYIPANRTERLYSAVAMAPAKNKSHTGRTISAALLIRGWCMAGQKLICSDQHGSP